MLPEAHTSTDPAATAGGATAPEAGATAAVGGGAAGSGIGVDSFSSNHPGGGAWVVPPPDAAGSPGGSHQARETRPASGGGRGRYGPLVRSAADMERADKDMASRRRQAELALAGDAEADCADSAGTRRRCARMLLVVYPPGCTDSRDYGGHRVVFQKVDFDGVLCQGPRAGRVGCKRYFVGGYETRGTRNAPGPPLPLDSNRCSFDEHAASNASEVSAPASVTQAPDAQLGTIDCSFGVVFVARQLLFVSSSVHDQWSRIHQWVFFRRVRVFPHRAPLPCSLPPFFGTEERFNPIKRIVREYAGPGPYSLLYRLHEENRRASVMIRRVNRCGAVLVVFAVPLAAGGYGWPRNYSLAATYQVNGCSVLRGV